MLMPTFGGQTKSIMVKWPVCILKLLRCCVDVSLTLTLTRILFVESPDNFSARRASCPPAIRLFCKADLLVCFWCKKNLEDCEVGWLRTSALWRCKGNSGTLKGPKSFGTFEKQACISQNTRKLYKPEKPFVKPRLQERFFALAGDAIFSNFVALGDKFTE